MSNDDAERRAQFTRHFSRCESSLYAFALSLIPNRADVEDIMQETLVALWENFSRYDPDRPFLPWASQFVYRNVQAHRRSEAVRLKYTFSEETIRQLVSEQATEEREQALHAALEQCVSELGEEQRELIRLRYHSSTRLEEVADRSGVSANALYKKAQRIRELLHSCITRRMTTAGWSQT